MRGTTRFITALLYISALVPKTEDRGRGLSDIKTPDRISERPPQGGLSFCAQVIWKCLLLAHSGQSNRTRVCPLLDQSGQRSFFASDGLSANDPKRTTAQLNMSQPRRGGDNTPWQNGTNRSGCSCIHETRCDCIRVICLPASAGQSDKPFS